MAKEHQEYIQTKVNPTLEALVTQVLLGRPDNPVPFMIEWLAKQTKASPTGEAGSEAESLREEIRKLQAEIGDLETKLKAGPAEKDPDAEEQEEEEEEDDVDIEDMAPPPRYNKGPRASVSAEAYAKWDAGADYKPPVYPKSEEQKTSLKGVLKSFIFEALSKDDKNVLIDAMQERLCEAGDRIIQEGDDGDCMYVIERGAFDCLKVIDGKEIVVKKCVPGDIFGELALLYSQKRAASVQAVEPAAAWSLDSMTFNHIVRNASVKKREMYENFISGVPLLEPLSAYDRGQLADSLHKEEKGPGETIFSQGDEGDKFYLVEKGTLSVQKSRDGGPAQEVLQITTGGYFGELALMKNDMRAATVVTLTECELLYVDRKTFKALLGPLEELMMKNASAYAP